MVPFVGPSFCGQVLTTFSGMAAFIVEGFSLKRPDPLEKETTHQCPLCNKLKKLKGMQDHVGHHILSRLCGMEEDSLIKPVCIYFYGPRPILTCVKGWREPMWFLWWRPMHYDSHGHR